MSEDDTTKFHQLPSEVLRKIVPFVEKEIWKNKHVKLQNINSFDVKKCNLLEHYGLLKFDMNDLRWDLTDKGIDFFKFIDL